MKFLAAIVLLALVPAGFAVESEVLPVTPGAAYRLSFEADGATEGSRWAVHLRDAGGNLPFDGVLEGEWQQLTPDRKTYTQLFRAPADATNFQVLVREPGVTLRNVRLEKWEPESLLLNGDFSEGRGNYSGWTERYNAQLAEKDGQTILRVDQNGYALTDYTPVAGGGRYQLKSQQGSPGCVLLAYDALRRFISVIERKAGAPFQVPEDAAYVRVIYNTWHAHLPSMRVNEIAKVELLELDVPGTEPLKIEKDGDWEIVLAPGSDPREEHAARELRHWMTTITGRAPALLAEASPEKNRKIFIGRSWADGFAEDLKALEGSDGYALRTKDGNIHVFGAHPRGALFGVHALLERNTDIIWPRPNPEFEALFSKAATLTFSDADLLSRPDFSGRHVSGAYGTKTQHTFQDWQGRNGLNTPWKLHVGNNYLVWQRGAKLGYGGSHIGWISKEIKEKDEKVLPMIDGKRVDNRWRQPCYTYPGTVDGIVAGIKEAMETLPGRDLEYISSIISDNWTVCGCPDCLAPITLPNGEKLETNTTDATKNPLFFSTRNFLMLNKVAEALEKDYPDLRIQTHAYIFTAALPKVKVHPAIIPEFAAYPTQNVRYPILSGQGRDTGNYTKHIWKRRFEQWGKEKKGELGYFGYYYTEGFNAVADTAAEDYRALAKFEAVQVHTEQFPVDGEELSSWDADGIEKWVLAKLMWDPSQDPETLRKHYIQKVYRGAEQEMAEFYQLIRDTWHSLPESVFVNCHTPADVLFQNLIINPKIEEKAKTLLASAEAAASDPRSKSMIQRTMAYFEKLGDTLGRVSVPLVEESANEWLEPSSPHWQKAAVVQGFRKVGDWRMVAPDTPTEYPTIVRIMHDGKIFYVRFDGVDENLAAQVKPSAPAGLVFPNGDRFELRLKNAKNQDFYFAVGPGGHYFAQPSQGARWKTFVSSDEGEWTGIMAIPMAVLGTENDRSKINARLGRVARLTGAEREESSSNGAGIYNDHGSFWLELQIK